MSEVERSQRLTQNNAANLDINDMDSMRPNVRQDVGKVWTFVDCPQVCRQTLDIGFFFAHIGDTLAGRPSILRATWRCFCRRDREVDSCASDDNGGLAFLQTVHRRVSVSGGTSLTCRRRHSM